MQSIRENSSVKKPLSACYLLTNSNNPANLGMYQLANGKALFDIGILFAANINGTYDEPSLYLNQTVVAALESGVITELQSKGIKVILSILGNHQEAGISTLTENGVKIFSEQLVNLVSKYGLDGLDFDDEYCTGTTNVSSFPSLISTLRKSMPNKLLTFYFIGGATHTLSYGDINVGDLLDYAWNPYYSSYNAPFIPHMKKGQLGAAAIDMVPADNTYTPSSEAASFAQRTLKDGYGVYVYYNLPNEDIGSYLTSVSRVLYQSKTTYTLEK